MLELAYILLNIGLLIGLILIGKYAINRSVTDELEQKKKLRKLIFFLLLWQAYVFAISITGFLQDFSLPPRFPIFLVMPAFLFTGIFIYRNRNAKWITVIPQSWLVYIQSFRIIVETLFVWTVAEGLLHPEVTIEGYNYDMIIGFLAPIVAYLVFNKKILSTKIAIAWNYLGLTVLASVIFVFISTIYFPQFYGSEQPIASTDFGAYPFTLVAAFLMPAAVFIHVLSLVQLGKEKLKVG